MAMLFVAVELGVNVESKLETSEVDELTIKYLMKEVHGDEIVAEEKKPFARPRGPQRRSQKGVNPASAGDSGTE